MEPTPQELFSILVRECGADALIAIEACLACARVDDRSVAYDILQQTFLAAWQHFEQYDRRRRFAAWLCTIARNETRAYFRSTSTERRHTRPLDPEIFDAVFVACEQLVSDRGVGSEEILAALRGCLATALKQRDREIVERVVRENENCEAVANSIGASARTVRRRLQEALDRLRDCIRGKLKVRCINV